MQNTSIAKIAAIFLLATVSISCARLARPSVSGDCGGPDDGRFTIGANNIRLMYGFPIPASTSHFVVNVDGKFASNYGGLGSDVKHICTTKKIKRDSNRKFSEMEFSFEGVIITQRLVPVDDKLVETDSLGAARYYRIEYELKNERIKTQKVGIQLLIDNMIADNDAPKLEGDGKKVSVETRFDTDNIPKQVFLYRTEGNLSDHTAEILTQQAQAVKPDELAIGRWPYFHKVIWDYTPNGQPYTDAAVLMKWQPRALVFLEKTKVATYYGMARKTDAKKQFVKETVKIETVFSEKGSSSLLIDTVYFDNADATLSPKFTKAIDKLLAGRNLQKLQGVIIEGHTDAVGSEDANVEYSRKRAKVVVEYLIKKGVQEYKIVPKGFGEMYADQSSSAQKKGKGRDRNAVLMMYFRE